jgi:16S rRNA (uracil1498-N3)-methyltransferase
VLENDLVVRGDEHRVARPSPHLTIAAAPPRVADRARLIVEKLAELGVDQLIWLETARGEGRPPRLDRSRAWVRAALEQSRGAYLLEVDDGGRPGGPWPEASRMVVCDLHGAAASSVLGGDQPILGLVGPEGGFSRDEVPDTADRLSLSSQVLRVETAAIAFAVLVRAP